MKKVLVALVLVPTLLGQSQDQLPDSVRALLRKPRGGTARLTFRDGTQSDGVIERVTDQYLSFTEDLAQIRVNLPCEHIDLTRIAGVKRLPPLGDDGFPLWYELLLAPVVLPVAAVSTIFIGHAIRGLPTGSWESVSANPVGRTRHVEFHDLYVAIPEVAVKQGRYHLDGDDLYFDYDSGAEEVVPIRFQCDTLVADRPDGRLQFSTSQWEGRAYSPIVGRWWMRNRDTQINWDLRPDGTFRIQNIEHDNWARMEPKKGGLKLSGSGEEWRIRRTHNRLFVTGVETEYKRTPPVR